MVAVRLTDLCLPGVGAGTGVTGATSRVSGFLLKTEGLRVYQTF
jgi:hypothetical protein